jgi:hypothetical protein
MNFLMIDGEGNPNTSDWYKDAVEVLYATAYALKFMNKKGVAAVDYAVMPLQGLWWVEDMTQFSVDDTYAWKWTAMIIQPEYVTRASFEEARDQAEKKGLVALPSMRFETFPESRAVQIMHLGPFANDGPTIDRLHRFIEEQGLERGGKHHEIYLSDPRRTSPERLRTVIRQSFG